MGACPSSSASSRRQNLVDGSVQEAGLRLDPNMTYESFFVQNGQIVDFSRQTGVPRC